MGLCHWWPTDFWVEIYTSTTVRVLSWHPARKRHENAFLPTGKNRDLIVSLLFERSHEGGGVGVCTEGRTGWEEDGEGGKGRGGGGEAREGKSRRERSRGGPLHGAGRLAPARSWGSAPLPTVSWLLPHDPSGWRQVFAFVAQLPHGS